MDGVTRARNNIFLFDSKNKIANQHEFSHSNLEISQDSSIIRTSVKQINNQIEEINLKGIGLELIVSHSVLIEEEELIILLARTLEVLQAVDNILSECFYKESWIKQGYIRLKPLIMKLISSIQYSDIKECTNVLESTVKTIQQYCMLITLPKSTKSRYVAPDVVDLEVLSKSNKKIIMQNNILEKVTDDNIYIMQKKMPSCSFLSKYIIAQKLLKFPPVYLQKAKIKNSDNKTEEQYFLSFMYSTACIDFNSSQRLKNRGYSIYFDVTIII